ncbi:MAG: UDP-N-acetylglucosamine 2-epimerase (non-hydrolyzing) [Ruminococcaceae bacterium]|nr:UDP-N-acetylglucosamine 2-epimerase (non-hydrolyzing) [Oscillospiraceae bacterium]
MVIFGTRPEAVKLCPLIRELKERGFSCFVCVTGQHRELLDGVLRLFDVVPDEDLNMMKEGQDLFDVTCGVLAGLRPILVRESPELVLVHGDTATSFAAALACFYCGIPVAHVEAGLRTYDLSAPYPEEWNRRAVGLLAAHHFAPTERAAENLRREGVPSDRIAVTGNTGIDALRVTVRKEYSHPELEWAKDSRLILLTAHRRESRGSAMRSMFRGIRRILAEFPDVKLLYPVHPGPAVRQIAWEELGDCDRLRLIEPLGVLDFHNFLARCHLVLTDSGGLQEEAPALGKPVLVMRNTTERPEGLEAGCMRLVGTGEGSVYRGVRELLENEALYAVMSRAPNPYGDGFACRRIAEYLERL